MGARRRGTGYFGKTGTVSRESRPRRHLSRRQFLAGTTLTGVALTLPPWLVGCGEDDDHCGRRRRLRPRRLPRRRLSARPRERRTLHFDFSFSSLHELRLQAIGSQSHQAPILEHTAESRARARQLNPALADVPDERLTHYIEDVDLPADALQHLWVTGSDTEDNAALAVMHIHVPAAARQAAQQRALAAGGGDRVGRGGPAPASGVLNGGNDYLTPVSTAVALVFHNPEIMNLNVDQGATILNLIQTLPCTDDPMCTPYLGTLAAQIAEKWPATTSGGWATLVQVTDANGKPVVNSQGKPAYRWDVDPDISQAASAVAAQIKKAIFDDPQFLGTNWHPTQGITVSQTSATSGLTGRPAGAAQFALTAAYPAGASVHGVAFDSVSVTNQASRTVQLQFRNAYLRYLSTYVQFANENGDLPVANPTKEDTSRAKFLSWINSNYTILGIPALRQRHPAVERAVRRPGRRLDRQGLLRQPRSRRPGVLSGIAGRLDPDPDPQYRRPHHPAGGRRGGDRGTAPVAGAADRRHRRPGPARLLAAHPRVAGSRHRQRHLRHRELRECRRRADQPGQCDHQRLLRHPARPRRFWWSWGWPSSPARRSISWVLSRLIFRAIAVVADVAMIAQTVGEVLASPALFINQLSLTQTTTVTISHDMNDFQFPATARKYEVTLTYDSASKVAHKQCGTIEPGRIDPHRRRVRRRAVGRHGDRRRVPDHRERLHRRTQHRPGRDDPRPVRAGARNAGQHHPDDQGAADPAPPDDAVPA